MIIKVKMRKVFGSVKLVSNVIQKQFSFVDKTYFDDYDTECFNTNDRKNLVV